MSNLFFYNLYGPFYTISFPCILKIFGQKTYFRDEGKGFIFVSQDFDKKDRLLVLVHDAGLAVKAGQWSDWYVTYIIF